MYTLIKSSDFISFEAWAREIGFQQFMWDLRYKLFFEDEELDLCFSQALEVETLLYYLGEMRDEGLGTFVLNYESNLQDKRWVNIILRGFDHCGAKQNKDFFELILQNREVWKSCDGYFPGGPEARRKHEEKIRKIQDEYYYLDKDLVATIREGEPPLFQLVHDYISKINNLKIVSDKNYEAELEKLKVFNPHYEQRRQELAERNERRKEIEQNKTYRPPYSDLIQIVCGKNQLNLISVKALDYGEGIVSEQEVLLNKQQRNRFYHLITDKGCYYIVNDGRTTLLFDEDSHQCIDSVPSKEIYEEYWRQTIKRS